MPVQSFYQYYYFKLILSNYFYPSAFEEDIPVNDFDPLSRTVTYVRHTPSFLEKTTSRLALPIIGILLSPIGACYHGAQAMRYLKLDSKLSQEHLNAFDSDFILAVRIYSLFAVIPIIRVFYKIIKDDNVEFGGNLKTRQIALGEAYCIFSLFNFYKLITEHQDPLLACRLFASRRESKDLAEKIVLKKHFGIEDTHPEGLITLGHKINAQMTTLIEKIKENLGNQVQEKGKQIEQNDYRMRLLKASKTFPKLDRASVLFQSTHVFQYQYIIDQLTRDDFLEQNKDTKQLKALDNTLEAVYRSLVACHSLENPVAENATKYNYPLQTALTSLWPYDLRQKMHLENLGERVPCFDLDVPDMP